MMNAPGAHKRLEGKIIAVTGAEGGIGGAASRAFAAEGASLILMGVRQPELAALRDEVAGDHVALPVDIRDEAQVASAFETVRSRFGRLDVLYNCAGIHRPHQDAPVDQLDLAVWTDIIATNLTGFFLTCKHALQIMLTHRSGSIINCGSPTGMSGRGWRHHAYAASKGGVHALTKAIAVAYGPRGIRANCIVPGTIRTEMTTVQFADPEQVAQTTARAALRRLGEPSDLVGLALYLASDESAFATGSMFVIDGGVNAS